MPKFAAVLLAGGASRRMGRPKALLEVAGAKLWRRQMGLLQQLEPAEIMISAGTDWTVESGPWTVVCDRVPGLGPLGGIDAALRTMSSKLLLVLAVDMPAMSAGFLAGLVCSAGSQGIVPEEGGIYQGLAAIYPREIGPLLDEGLQRGDHSLQGLVKRAIQSDLVKARPIVECERALFRNANHPADLEFGA